MNKLDKASKVVIKDCLKVKRDEKVLIITDKNKLKIANSLLKEAKKISKTDLIKIPVGKVDSEELPKKIAELMEKYNVVIAPTTKSITHTNASRNAVKKGARVATMPGISEDMMKRTLSADYKKIEKRINQLEKVLFKSKIIEIRTKLGTSIKFFVEGRKWEKDTGIFKKNTLGNLPGGEISIAPLENKTQGIFIVDSSMLTKLKKPIKFEVKSGYATKISNKKIKDLLKNKGKNAYNIAELGIGLNERAKITGNILEDEKVLGTIHIALGDNKSLGGKISAPIHIDGVILKPTIIADNKIIMKEGKFLRKLFK